MRQRGRIQENPVMRMIPVVDDEGNTKCSFDARSDAMRGRFRRTTCKEDNTLEVTTYNDVLCTEESEHGAAVRELVRGECQPLKIAEHDDGERRRLAEDEGIMGRISEKVCGESNNSFTDLIQGLLCEEEGDDDEEQDNPCDGLDKAAKCKKQDSCSWEKGTCVWENAPVERQNFYVVYEWMNLTKDGEETDETFCYAKPSSPVGDISITDKKIFGEVCSLWGSLENQEACEAWGCKFKKGKCDVNKKVKCSKLGNDDVEFGGVETVCNAFAEAGCKFTEKKGKCGGKAKL